MPRENQRPKHADFVSQVVKDPKSPPDALLLQGFPGASSEKGHTRLYFDAQLTSYVEIPDDSILFSRELASAQSPLGGSYVWIKRDAQVIPGGAGSGRVKAAFLEGPIIGAAGMPNPDWPGGGLPFPTAFCPPPTLTCPTRICPTPACPTLSWAGCQLPTPPCPTRPLVCNTSLPRCHTIIDCYTQPWQCKTQWLSCPTKVCTVAQCGFQTATPVCININTVACPSALDACPSSLGCEFPGGFPGGFPVG